MIIDEKEHQCPFCLAGAEKLEVFEVSGGYQVVCGSCAARGPWAESGELAVLAWRTRFHGTTEILHTNSKVIKQCDSCGSFLSDLGYHWLAPIAYCPACGAKVVRE